MQEVRGERLDGSIRIALSGRIDSGNAAEAEREVFAFIGEGFTGPVMIDASDLEYISSAGLRMLLHLRKEMGELTIAGVNSDVYEILDMTGFTQMMTVEKAYREVSIEGCEEIGRGANGTVYRIDEDNVVKVYNDSDALDDIQHEREVARTALILGIPTAISYDVVKVGDTYGSVFELLNSRSFASILANEPERMDWCVGEYVKMLKRIHDTLVPEGSLPDIRETVIGWAEFMKDHLPEWAGEKLLAMVRAVPHDDHMIHGDYHTRNIVLQGDEVLLIDMDTLAVGNRIFELGSMFNAFLGFSEYDHEVVKKFQGFDYDTSRAFWHKVLQAYLGTESETKIREVEDKARIVGYMRLIRRSIRRGGLEDGDRRAEIELWKGELLELLERIDTLLFIRDELEIEADVDNLHEVLGFIETHLTEIDCSPRDMMQINIAAEEIFVNISTYAYAPDKGKAVVRVEVSQDPVTVTITFIDGGVPYDPLQKEDPDVSLPASEREVGGLGIFMTKQAMDDVIYEYKDGRNILTLKKNL